MRQETMWFELRLVLLQTHLQEQKQGMADRRQAMHVLQAKHQAERDQFIVSTSSSGPLRWSALITRQAEEITRLMQASSQQQSAMLARQNQEAFNLDQEIDDQKPRSNEVE